MSGASIALSELGAGGTALDPLLSALYGSTGSGNSDPVQALQQAQQIEPQEVQLTAQQPQVARTIAEFESAVNSATSVSQLLSNTTVQQVLLTASGMSDQIGYSALFQQALESNPSDSNALVNQLSDTRWLTLNQTYNFATTGLSTIQNAKVLSDVASSYAEQTWLTSLNSTTPGLSNALSFLSQASTITSASQILSDPLFFSVVTTALGIPEEIVLQDQNAQEQAITSQVDVSQFQNPTFVQNFTDQYMIAMQQSGTTSTSVSLASLAAQATGLVV